MQLCAHNCNGFEWSSRIVNNHFGERMHSMTSRERALAAMNFKPTDRLPRDMGGMRSTSISAFAYPKLVAALGLKPRATRIEDTGQMLALPDLDVLDALGCDFVTILNDVTNAIPQPRKWKSYDFNGRLPGAKVRNPENFHAESDGSIKQGDWAIMLPDSHVFDAPHGGQPVDLMADLPKPDLAQMRKDLKKRRLTEKTAKPIVELCRQVRESTDRAVFFNNSAIQAPMGIAGYGGMAVFPILCMTEPDFVAELHEIVTEHVIHNISLLMPKIAPYVDVALTAADDWGTQNQLIAPPDVFRTLFLPYHKRINTACHAAAPDVKIFLHSCGAIYDILDMIIEAGFDILNPIQWPAGGRTPLEWKEKCRKRLTMWGGGINSQATLPLGTVDDVGKEAARVSATLGADGGYVFCCVHNILAEIAPEKVVALYQAAGGVRQ